MSKDDFNKSALSKLGWDIQSDEEEVSFSDEDNITPGSDEWLREQEEILRSFSEDPYATQPLTLDGKGKIKAAVSDGILTFDDMKYVIHARNSARLSEGKALLDIFLCTMKEELADFVKNVVRDERIGNVKIGVVYRPSGHSTPILIEKDGEYITFYNVDSTLFDTDDSDQIKQDLLYVVQECQPCELYSLAFDSSKTDIAYRRQYDEYSCATYSLIDCHKMFKPYFSQFAFDNSAPVDPRVLAVLDKGFKVGDDTEVYNLTALPVEFMKSMQSLKGRHAGGVTERKGMQQLLEENPQLSNVPVIIGGKQTTLAGFLKSLIDLGSPNTVISDKNAHYRAIAAPAREKKLPFGGYDLSKVTEDDLLAIATRQNAVADPSKEVIPDDSKGGEEASSLFAANITPSRGTQKKSIKPGDVKSSRGRDDLTHSV